MTERINYIMDDPREARRLIDKVDADAWVSRYLEKHMQANFAVLDVGCGPGALSRAIARHAPTRSVVGIDASSERIDWARRWCEDLPNVQFRVGLAGDLPAEDGQFDLVFCRFLLEYLPDPANAVAEMLRVCRRGGKVILQDLDGQIVSNHPCPIDLQQRIRLVVDALAKTGFDPHIGRKLFQLAHAAGLTEIDVDLEPYHLYAGNIDAHNASLWERKLDIARPAIRSHVGSEVDADRFVTDFMAMLHAPDSLSFSNLFTVIGTKAT